MKNKYVLIVIVVLSALLVGMSALKRSGNNTPNDSSNDVIKPVTVTSADNILKNPSQYKGLIAVEGKVVMVDESNSTFGLGCRDRCLILPVKYRGKLPKKNNNVTVYGEVKKIEGKGYIFESNKVIVK